jgi:hypothetical protein
MVHGNLEPGVYLEEIPSGIHPIEGVPTSITAFVGAAAKGPVTGPGLVSSFPDFERQYGGLTDGMPLGYAVQQYFANGGTEALIARVESSGAQLVDADLSDPALEKRQRGLWLLDQAERFNILCIPPLAPATDVGKATWDTAVAYAGKRGAFVIVDPPTVWANAQAVTAASLATLVSPAANAAVYFPRLRALIRCTPTRPQSSRRAVPSPASMLAPTRTAGFGIRRLGPGRTSSASRVRPSRFRTPKPRRSMR